MNASALPVSVSPEALTITWLAVGGLVIELLVLIVFLTRASWWLSQRFSGVDASVGTVAKDVAQLKTDVGNDIAGRRVVAEARSDIAEMKAALRDIRERVVRLEEHEDNRQDRPPDLRRAG